MWYWVLGLQMAIKLSESTQNNPIAHGNMHLCILNFCPLLTKKMPKIDTLDALEEHEEHDDDYQTITNWNANW